MTDEEKKDAVENYVRAYNRFDTEQMLADLDDDVIFKNISNGAVTLEIKGIDALREQAEQIVDFFTEREQKITKFCLSEDLCEIEIDYRATLAADLPNGTKAGDRIELEGRSIFHFSGGKISEIQDIS